LPVSFFEWEVFLECGALPPLSFVPCREKAKESGGKAPHSKKTKTDWERRFLSPVQGIPFMKRHIALLAVFMVLCGLLGGDRPINRTAAQDKADGDKKAKGHAAQLPLEVLLE